MKPSLVIAVVFGIIVLSQGVFGWWSSSRRRRSSRMRVVNSGGSSKKCFAQICSSNSFNLIRGRDSQGGGHFGAPRGTERTHRGIDIVCTADSSVYAAFPANVLGDSIPYDCRKYPQHCGKDYNTGIYMKGTDPWEGYEVKMWYVAREVRKGHSVDAGSFIGTMRDRAAASPGMTNHVHVQLYKNKRIVDPTPYVC